MSRKSIELRTKASALANELEAWRAAAVPGGPFDKHHSQVERLREQIGTALTALQSEITAGIGTPEEIETRIIDLHRIWDFFRSKLVLRAFDHFRRYLAVADELAYDCYLPALPPAADAKEPPLTFFSTVTTPYAIPRAHPYAFAITGDAIRDEATLALLKAMPVPVISVPWFQQSHLPDLAIVAHEAGHHVEEALELAPLLDAALRGAALEHPDAWLAWRGEVFADVWATLAVGRAYPRALLDFLTITDLASLLAESVGPPLWGAYPTSALRIDLACRVLTVRNTLDAATSDAVRVVKDHAMRRDFAGDAETVVDAMLATKIANGKPVAQLIAFTDVAESNAATAAAIALNDGMVASNRVRELVAASVLAFAKDPEHFHQSAQEALRKRIAESIEAGVRGIPPIEVQQNSVAAHAVRDRAAGMLLLRKLRGKS